MSEAVVSMYDMLHEEGGHEERLTLFNVVTRACGGVSHAPGLDRLVKSLKSGTDPQCVLDSALHLTVVEYETLEAIAQRIGKAAPNLPKIRRRRK